MAEIFRSAIEDFEKLKISDALQLVKVVEEVIARDIRTEEIDVLVNI